jgi:hypothetical protein
MCASFFNMGTGMETTMATNNKAFDEPTVVPTPNQGGEHVQQVIYLQNITCSYIDSYNCLEVIVHSYLLDFAYSNRKCIEHTKHNSIWSLHLWHCQQISFLKWQTQ